MLAHAVLSAFPRFLFFLFLFFFLETSSSAGRWAMGFGKELRKQLRKWLMAADKPDSSTPYSETQSQSGETPAIPEPCSPRASHTSSPPDTGAPSTRGTGGQRVQVALAQSSVHAGLSMCLHTEMGCSISGCCLGQRKQRVQR